jgi:hypothetical protein
MPALPSELPLVIGFLVFVLFPLSVVVLALRRDQQGLAVLTFVAMFVGLGPLVALLTLLRLAHKI